MPYVEVWVDDPDPDLNEVDVDDLIDEIQKRGYTVMRNLYDKNRDIQDLYNTYQTCSRELFEKQLKSFFRERLDVVP